MGLAGLLFYARVSDLASLNFILTPLLSIVLIFEYHRKVGEDQTLYFSFIFCMLGDLMTISSDFYNFTSGLIAYWGASILFNFSLSRELQIPFKIAIKKPVFFSPSFCMGCIVSSSWSLFALIWERFFVPILIYGLTLSLTCAMGLGVYFQERTIPRKHFATGLIVLSATASLIGINRFYLKSDFLYGVETLLYAPTLFFIFMYYKTKPSRVL